MSNTTFIKLCKKKVSVSPTQSFNAYFCYRVILNDKGQWEDIVTPTTNGQIKTTSIRVALSSSLRKEFEKEDKFPYILELDNSTDKDYYITKDKDSKGKVRLDKNGQSHLILVLRSYTSKQYLEHIKVLVDDLD